MALIKAKLETKLELEAYRQVEVELGRSLYPHLRLDVNEDTGEIHARGFDPEYYSVVLTMEYDGLVCDSYTDRSVRIMSDVWADIFYIVAYNPETDWFEHVQVGNSEFSGNYSTWWHRVDASPEILEKYAAYSDGKRQGTRFRGAEIDYDRCQNRMQQDRKTVQRGKTVEVVRGRKVRVGTRGLVFWVGDNGWGTSVGIAISQRKDQQGRWADVVWTAANNCAVVERGRVLS